MLKPTSDPERREWDALYAFGDSFSDSGAGYVDCDGPTAIAYLAEILGIAFTHARDPAARGTGLNFAVSGASTGGSEGFWVRPVTAPPGAEEALLGRGMRKQVEDFLARVEGGELEIDSERTLFFLAGGLNDHDLATEASIFNLSCQVQALHGAGAKFILIASLPTRIAPFSNVAARLNPALEELAMQLQRQLAGARIALSNWGRFFDRVMENASTFGITNVTDRCAGRAIFGEDPTPAAMPHEYFFYHAGHPSTAVHRLVASEMARDIREVFS